MNVHDIAVRPRTPGKKRLVSLIQLSLGISAGTLALLPLAAHAQSACNPNIPNACQILNIEGSANHSDPGTTPPDINVDFSNTTATLTGVPGPWGWGAMQLESGGGAGGNADSDTKSGGAGAMGSNVTVNVGSGITANGVNGGGILRFTSQGGNGGGGETGGLGDDDPGTGGMGGGGGILDVTMNGNVSSSDAGSPGLYVLSMGGSTNYGSQGTDGYYGALSGDAGGSNKVTVSIGGSINTVGAGAVISAQGGQGVRGADDTGGYSTAEGRDGGVGGKSVLPMLVNFSGTINSSGGDGLDAVALAGAGGAGGLGEDASSVWSGAGGAGGFAPTATVTMTGGSISAATTLTPAIASLADPGSVLVSTGVTAQSVGGAGGAAGKATGSESAGSGAVGGGGGNGGYATAATLTMDGGTSVTGGFTVASALSVGGAGGIGGSAGGASGTGGNGGTGGAASTAQVTVGSSSNGGASVIGASQQNVTGVLAASWGGAGGAGAGNADGYDYTTGGMGASGGNAAGATATIEANGVVQTHGLDNAGSITSGGVQPQTRTTAGVSVQSNGGAGGGGGPDHGVGPKAGDAGQGGSGGVATAVINGSVSTTGSFDFGVLAQSAGGMGGRGGDAGGLFGAHGGVAANGGGSNNVYVSGSSGTISTAGTGSAGILAQSIGGGGGAGGNALAFQGAAIGGNGGAGGDGQSVSVGINGTDSASAPLADIITTTGNDAAGIIAQSVGGGGGNGGSVLSASLFSALAIGGDGKGGGAGGSVTVQNDGVITTFGTHSGGLQAQSVGGGGGNGGAAIALAAGVQVSTAVAVGGDGGGGGDGSYATATNTQQISTYGANSYGMKAQSISGGGGQGGKSLASALNLGGDPEAPTVTATVGVGGTGGAGGDLSGIWTTAVNSGLITTAGDGSIGIVAQSVAGGGGDGGDATASSYVNGGDEGTTITANVAVGGGAGNGGTGGNVQVTNTGAIVTTGADAYGVYAQSLGGGGGIGGAGDVFGGSVGSADSYTGNITVGGSGGKGSAGGNVTFNPGQLNGGGSIATGGDGANAIFAQSVGGGGGASGGGTAKGNNGDVSLTLNLGGNAGSGGTGGTVTVTNNNTLLTKGADADAIFAQSVGGSGGKAGKGASTLGGSQDQGALSTSMQTTLADGLNTGSGNALSLGNGAYKIGSQAWQGLNSLADLENVLGGGVGSSAGLRDDEDDDGTANNIKLNATIGGQGGSGGTGNTVTVVSYQAIGTDGTRSDGIFAQSVGGGGGSGGATSFSGSTSGGGDDDGKTSGKLTLGGNGVSGGDGGSVNVNNGAPITTKGVSSYGVDAQSIGGGGGKAGATASKQGALKDMSVTVGGSGGAGGDGKDVTVNSDGTITTGGREAFGILAQSIGGGGGNAHVLSSDIGADTNDDDVQLTATIGGSGGAGGKGNTVLVTAGVNYTGSINTSGADAIGIVAQSIGGGGGTLTATGATNDDTQNDGIQHTTLVPLTIGDKNGSSGDAATVTVTYGVGALATPSAISTAGAGAYGILAQSIGGGGGLFLGATPSTSMANLFAGSNQVGNGSTVDVTLQNKASVTTAGAGAVGIFAQSVGGGGGVFGSMQDVNLKTGWQAPSTTENGQGGNVNVTLTGGAHVTTTGADAHGIFAQAAGGGGGVIGGANTSGYVFSGATPFGGCSGSTCTGNVLVNLQQASGVTVSGSGAYGVYAISRGNGSNNVNVTVDSTSAVAAKGSAAGTIYMDGANTNTLDNFGLIDDGTATNGGVVSTSGMAIVSPDAVTVVNHQGATFNGNASLGGGTVTNEQGATLQATSLAFAGNHGTVTNAGTLEVGGRKPTSLQVNGDLAQASTGRIVFDADMVGHANDQVNVAGNASLAGSLEVRPVSLANGTMKVLDVAGAMDISQLGVTNPFLVNYSLASQGVAASSEGHQSVYLTPHANFAASSSGLTSNEQAVAAHLQQNFDAGALAMGTSFAALANGVQNATQYKAALDTLGNEAQQAVGVARVAASQAFVERMNSCPAFDGPADTMMHERDCFWARAVDNGAGLGGAGSVGYSSSNHSFQIGGQRAIADGWFLGGSVAYDNSTVTSNEGAGNVKGNGGELGVVLKRELGNWTISGSADVGRGSYDTQRYIGFPGYAARAQGNFHLDQEGLHARIAYLVPEEHWYLKPYVDLNAVHVHTTGYSEKGAGALGLDVSSASDTMHSVSPMLEAGGRWDLANGMTLRPYAAIGGAWYDRNRWGASSQFEGAAPGVDSFTSLSTAPTYLTKANVGLDWSLNQHVQLRLEYDGKFADHYHDNEGVFRVNYQF